MTARKYSRQRESIKQFLMTRTDHPTADTVFLNIRQAFPNISLGTVYRYLNLLSEMGEIMKITTDGGADRFDGNTMRHHHFICTCCHCVSDLNNMENIDSIMDAAQKATSGQITGYTANFYGLCENCRNSQEKGA